MNKHYLVSYFRRATKTNTKSRNRVGPKATGAHGSQALGRTITARACGQEAGQSTRLWLSVQRFDCLLACYAPRYFVVSCGTPCYKHTHNKNTSMHVRMRNRTNNIAEPANPSNIHKLLRDASTITSSSTSKYLSEPQPKPHTHTS